MIPKLFVFVLAALFCNAFASDAECPQGAVLSPFDPNICYMVSSNALDYYSAADFCEQAEGHLTSVHNAFENSYLRGAASSIGADTVWIGGSNNNAKGIWKWEDSSAFDWTDWGPGQPNGTAGLCLSVSTHDGFWYGEKCAQAKPFFCKVNPTKRGLASCPNGVQ
uniref:C-type lectin domain-containing protein n=1 Tax=Panagrolaimus superbus TaxID=310955 RepID=A0A914YQH6_9BILA